MTSKFVPVLATAAVSLPGLAGCSPAEETAVPQGTDSLAERVTAFLSPYVDGGNFSGVVLVAREEEALLKLAFGDADDERVDTVRRVGKLIEAARGGDVSPIPVMVEALTAA